MVRLACIVTVFAALAVPSVAGATVLRWGSYNGLGLGKKTVPTEVKFTSQPGPIVKVDAGNAESFAVGADGVLWAFGRDGAGQLGNGEISGSDQDYKASPVDFPPGTDIVAVGEGREAGFAIDSTGQGWSWGRSVYKPKATVEGNVSSLCLGALRADVLTPMQVPGLTGVQAVQGGGTHVLWLTDSGTVEACGAGAHGQLGTGTTESSLTPIEVPGLSGIVEISAGKATSCARTASGEVFTWGYDQFGQVGNGRFEESVLSPYDVPLPGPASEVSCGGNNGNDGTTLALVEGIVYGWGADEADQIGDGQQTAKASPTAVTEALALDVTQVVASGESSLALAAEGDVYGWGSNKGFALAMPKESEVFPTPRLIDSGVREISGTAFDALALTR